MLMQREIKIAVESKHVKKDAEKRDKIERESKNAVAKN